MESKQVDKLTKKIHELEVGQASLKQEMLRLMQPGGARGATEHRQDGVSKQRSYSVSPQRSGGPSARRLGVECHGATSKAMGRKGPVPLGHSSPLRRESTGQSLSVKIGATSDQEGGGGIGLSDRQYPKILQSMGQSVHVFDLKGKIFYWNRSAEQLYGYSASEALGQDAVELLVDARDFGAADNIINRISAGESWTGRFPVKNKFGERFLAIATNTPFYSDDGGLVGIICVSSDSRYFLEVASPSTSASHTGRSRTNLTGKIGLDIQQPFSKITTLANKVTNKVRSKIKASEGSRACEIENRANLCSGCVPPDAATIDRREDTTSIGASTLREDVPPNPFGHTYVSSEEKSPGKTAKANIDNSEGKAYIHKILSSKAEARITKTGLGWPWRGNEPDRADTKNWLTRSWSQNDHECDANHQKSNDLAQKMEGVDKDDNRIANNDVSGSSSSFNANSMSSVSSSGSTTGSTIQKIDIQANCLDYEILWEDLTIGEQIGQGSCGTVYHALWYGSDVAVKVFSRQEYSDDVILSFRQEVSVMKRLRHPNILLFMGAVTSPQRLCIVSEFLPRGSLFRLLQRSTAKLDWRRRVHMALDIVG